MNSTWTKTAPPSAVCTGADVEMITEGGDAGFVVRMVEESQEHRETVQWYTSMLGKLSSASVVIDSLKSAGCRNWAVGSLVTGGKTRRWVVGWSWGDFRPRNVSLLIQIGQVFVFCFRILDRIDYTNGLCFKDVARGEVPNKSILPFPTEYSIALQGKSRETAAAEINNVMVNLELRWMWKQERWAGLAFASENVWSRAARRKQQRKGSTADSMEVDRDEEEKSDVDTVLLGVKITVAQDTVEIRWLRGLDNVLFESFCGMLKRHLAA